MKFDTERAQKVFASQQIKEAADRVVLRGDDLRFDVETKIAVLWTLSSIMVELGLNKHEDFYL